MNAYEEKMLERQEGFQEGEQLGIAKAEQNMIRKLAKNGMTASDEKSE